MSKMMCGKNNLPSLVLLYDTFEENHLRKNNQSETETLSDKVSYILCAHIADTSC